MMPGILPLNLAMLLASPPDAGRVPGITTELPGGAGATFRPAPEELQPEARPAPAAESPTPATRVKLPRLSSRFGVRSDPLRRAAAVHYGIDIPGPLGTLIRAAAPGLVRFAGAAGSYGGMVEIAHGGALETRYAHLSRILVRPGTRVEQGQPVALMGSTGRSTGSHLHFEVRVGGSAVDPLPWLQTLPDAPMPRATVAAEPVHLSAFARARAAAQAEGQAL